MLLNSSELFPLSDSTYKFTSTGPDIVNTQMACEQMDKLQLKKEVRLFLLKFSLWTWVYLIWNSFIDLLDSSIFLSTSESISYLMLKYNYMEMTVVSKWDGII